MTCHTEFLTCRSRLSRVPTDLDNISSLFFRSKAFPWRRIPAAPIRMLAGRITVHGEAEDRYTFTLFRIAESVGPSPISRLFVSADYLESLKSTFL